MFPIHNLTGRVIGFGGRILVNDKKSPKYQNSPESEIYDKKQTLYGIYFAKNAIARQDECILVEGYFDVLRMHHIGIENVVASSGTSLTMEQIRLVKRYTKNITMLYDGDAAGIHAALRGTDMILSEGMNVRVVVLPPEHDPDTFGKEYSVEYVTNYLKENAKDFIRFKTELLLKDAESDPIKRGQVIRDIVETISGDRSRHPSYGGTIIEGKPVRLRHRDHQHRRVFRRIGGTFLLHQGARGVVSVHACKPRRMPKETRVATAFVRR